MTQYVMLFLCSAVKTKLAYYVNGGVEKQCARAITCMKVSFPGTCCLVLVQIVLVFLYCLRCKVGTDSDRILVLPEM